MQKTITYSWIQHGHRSFVRLNQDGGLVVMRSIFHIESSNMATVMSCIRLLNINKIQYNHRFFVWINQYGGRYVVQKTTQYS